jgi:hypothetical protein
MDQKSVPSKATAEQVFKDTRRQTRWQEKDPYRARGAGGRGPLRPRCNGAFYLKVVQNYPDEQLSAGPHTALKAPGRYPSRSRAAILMRRSKK